MFFGEGDGEVFIPLGANVILAVRDFNKFAYVIFFCNFTRIISNNWALPIALV